MKRWHILLLLFVLAEGALLMSNAALDTFLWRSTRWLMGDQDRYKWADLKAAHAADPNAPFYHRVDPPFTRTSKHTGRPEATLYKKTEKFWRLFRDFGEPHIVAILAAVVWIYDRRRWKAAAILVLAAALAGAAGMAVRASAGRLRPDGKLLNEQMQVIQDSSGEPLRNQGGNYWFPGRGFSFSASDLAFPSGHATLAFALAAVLTYFSPRGAALFFTIAALCALTRVVMQAHFYADALCGAALGGGIGTLTATVADRLIPGPRECSPAA